MLLSVCDYHRQTRQRPSGLPHRLGAELEPAVALWQTDAGPAVPHFRAAGRRRIDTGPTLIDHPPDLPLAETIETTEIPHVAGLTGSLFG